MFFVPFPLLVYFNNWVYGKFPTQSWCPLSIYFHYNEEWSFSFVFLLDFFSCLLYTYLVSGLLTLPHTFPKLGKRTRLVAKYWFWDETQTSRRHSWEWTPGKLCTAQVSFTLLGNPCPYILFGWEIPSFRAGWMVGTNQYKVIPKFTFSHPLLHCSVCM